MKNRDCNTRNHRHGVFPKKPSSRNFRTRVIPYYSIFGIYGMSKTLDSGCSTEKINFPKKHPQIFSQENCVFYLYYAKREKICQNTEFFLICESMIKKFFYNVFLKKLIFAW